MESVKKEDILYYAQIRAAAATGSERVIENGCPEHAVYLMRKMFECAQDKVRIFSGSLMRRVSNSDGEVIQVYSDKLLIDSIVEFLRPKGRQMEIVVADGVDGGENDHPLVLRLKNESKSIRGHSSISKLNATGRQCLTEETDGHFIVMDEKGYRLETDDMKVKAYASFGDSKSARVLADFFDSNLLPNADSVVRFA